MKAENHFYHKYWLWLWRKCRKFTQNILLTCLLILSFKVQFHKDFKTDQFFWISQLFDSFHCKIHVIQNMQMSNIPKIYNVHILTIWSIYHSSLNLPLHMIPTSNLRLSCLVYRRLRTSSSQNTRAGIRRRPQGR